MYTYPYNVNGNVQQQLAQNRMEQLQQQYNSMFPQNNMMMQQVAKNNPMFARAQQMAAGKTPEQIKQVAENLCKQRGIDINAAMQQFQNQFSSMFH